MGVSEDPAITWSSWGWRGLGSLPFLALDSLQLSRLLNYNYSPLRLTYRNSLERTYGLYPERENRIGRINSDKYTNSRISNYRMTPFSLEQLNSFYTKLSATNSAAPIWIVNATADSNNYWPRNLNSKSNTPTYDQSIVEFTPFYYGNDYYGYYSSRYFTSNISEIVQASGAAVDSANPYNGFWAGIGGMVVSLGNYLEVGQSSVYLTDGGHSENLGTYSLIKRKIPVIAISDAEWDPKGQQEGMNRLRDKLLNQYGIVLKLNNINKEMSLPTHDYNSDPLPEIIRGTLVDKESGEPISKIYYVKLRLIRDKYECNQGAVNCYPQHLKEFISYNEIRRTFTEDFPHSKTSDISYSATQYLAYYTLGYHYGQELARQLKADKVINP